MKTASEEAADMLLENYVPPGKYGEEYGRAARVELQKRLRAEGRELKRLRGVQENHELQSAFEDAVTRAERAEAEIAAIIEKNAPEIVKINGWVSEQDAKIKRMAEALRVCDLALSKVSDGSTSGEFRKVYADALRDAGVTP